MNSAKKLTCYLTIALKTNYITSESILCGRIHFDLQRSNLQKSSCTLQKTPMLCNTHLWEGSRCEPPDSGVAAKPNPGEGGFPLAEPLTLASTRLADECTLNINVRLCGGAEDKSGSRLELELGPELSWCWFWKSVRHFYSLIISLWQRLFLCLEG